MDQIFTSSNPLISWLRQLDASAESRRPLNLGVAHPVY